MTLTAITENRKVARVCKMTRSNWAEGLFWAGVSGGLNSLVVVAIDFDAGFWHAAKLSLAMFFIGAAKRVNRYIEETRLPGDADRRTGSSGNG